MEQPKLLEFDEIKKEEVQQEKPQIEKQEIKEQQKEEKEAPQVKLLEEEKEKKQIEVQQEKIEENKEEKVQEEKQVKKEESTEQKEETENKTEGKEIKLDKKVLIEGIKLKIDEEEKKMKEDIIAKIKECKNPTEKLQLAMINEKMMKRKQLDKQLEKEIDEINKKYELMAEPLYKEMNLIINGEKTINQQELQNISFIKDEDKKKIEGNENKPIDQYWYKVFVNCEEISKDIQKKDEQALKSLKRLECIKEQNSENFTLVFEFGDNDHFNQCTLKKYFEMKDQDTAISSKCEPKIEWKEGKNLTVKTQKKKQKNKKTGKTRTITKEIPTESFFNFFNDANDDGECCQVEEEDDKIMHLHDQVDIALYLVDETIPYSLEYYLGVKQDYDSEIDDDISDDDNSDNDSDDEKIAKRKKSGGIGGGKKKSEDDIDKKNVIFICFNINEQKKDKKPHKKSVEGKNEDKNESKKGTEEKPECKQQ